MRKHGLFAVICLVLLFNAPGCVAFDNARKGEAPEEQNAAAIAGEAMFKETANTVSPDKVGRSVLEKLSTQDSLHGDHLLGQDRQPLVEGY